MNEEAQAHAGEAGMSGPRRFGYTVLGLLLLAMGFWIFPYQLERGDVLKTVLGAGLALLGGIVFVRALLGRSVEALETVLDGLSSLGGG